MTLKLKIVSVDHNGFCGRENHPDDSDIGLIVTPIAVVNMVCDEHTYEIDEEADMDAVREAARNTNLGGNAYTPGSTLLQCWTCVTGDGRLLDLMDFEVEVVR